MGQIVYADLLFLVNFSMDFLCLFVTARLLRRPFIIWRGMIASAMGGVYSVAVLFVRMNTLLGLIADLGFCVLMCLCAYGIKDKRTSEFLLHTTVYFGVSIGTGGCMTAMYSLLNRLDLPLGEVEKNPDGISVWLFGLLAVISGCVALLGGKTFKNISTDTISAIKISYGGAELNVRGMTDTGNLLKDPISGKPVIMIDSRALVGVISGTAIECALRGDITGLMAENGSCKARLIPIHTASGSSMVCAFVPDKLSISVFENKRKNSRKSSFEVDALFAPARLKLPNYKLARGCAALIPADITY